MLGARAAGSTDATIAAARSRTVEAVHRQDTGHLSVLDVAPEEPREDEAARRARE